MFAACRFTVCGETTSSRAISLSVSLSLSSSSTSSSRLDSGSSRPLVGGPVHLRHVRGNRSGKWGGAPGLGACGGGFECSAESLPVLACAPAGVVAVKQRVHLRPKVHEQPDEAPGFGEPERFPERVECGGLIALSIVNQCLQRKHLCQIPGVAAPGCQIVQPGQGATGNGEAFGRAFRNEDPHVHHVGHGERGERHERRVRIERSGPAMRLSKISRATGHAGPDGLQHPP